MLRHVRMDAPIRSAKQTRKYDAQSDTGHGGSGTITGRRGEQETEVTVGAGASRKRGGCRIPMWSHGEPEMLQRRDHVPAARKTCFGMYTGCANPIGQANREIRSQSDAGGHGRRGDRRAPG